MTERAIVKGEFLGIVPATVPVDSAHPMIRAVQDIEAVRAAQLRALQLDVLIQDAVIDVLQRSNGCHLVAFGDKVELNEEGAKLLAHGLDVDVEDELSSDRWESYAGAQGTPEFLVYVSVRVTDKKGGRSVKSTGSVCSEEGIHKERFNNEGSSNKTYGERRANVRAHAVTRGLKDAIDKLFGFPALTLAICDQLGLKYEKIGYNKGAFGGKPKETPAEQPAPAPKPAAPNSKPF